MNTMMCSPKKLLPLLVAAVAAPLCSSAFAPLLHPSAVASRRASINRSSQYPHHGLQAAASDDHHDLERLGKAASSALLALTLGFSTIAPPFANAAAADFVNAGPSSITIAAREKSEEDIVIKGLEQETRAVEKEAKADERKAKVEKSRKAFYDYEAKIAEQQEARIEAAEQKAGFEAEKDKVLAEKLKAEEQKIEEEATAAKTKEEKAAMNKMAKELLKKEKEVERKEIKAERAKRVFLAEEAQEQQILKRKEDAARAEENKFEAVEKEYESVADLAKEDELELGFAKSLLKK